jgi:hypothetical protein
MTSARLGGVVAVVENRWPDQPGNLPVFRVWLQPSEIKEMSIINHIALLPISEIKTL